MTTAAITNVQVGALIEMGHTGVSRIRSGDRLPSVDKMIDIEVALDWPVSEQVAARTPRGKYAQEFERHLARKFGKVVDDVRVSPTA